LFSLFDTFNPNFEIVEPKKPSNWRWPFGLHLTAVGEADRRLRVKRSRRASCPVAAGAPQW